MYNFDFFTLVEDPTEDCQAVRDFIDLCRCEKLACFADEKLKNGFSSEMEEELRTKLKINKVGLVQSYW